MRIAKNFENLYEEYRKLAENKSDKVNDYNTIIKNSFELYLNWHIKTAPAAGTKSSKESILEMFEAKIHNYLMSHLYSIKYGFSPSSYTILRSVYEDICMLYALICYEDILEIFTKNLTKDSLSENERNKLYKTYKENYKFLKPSFIRKKLYSDNILTTMNSFYDNMSERSHPTIKGLEACYAISEEQLDDSLRLGIILATFNLVIIVEIYRKDIDKESKNKIKNIIKIFYKYEKSFFNFFPNKNEASSKLFLKNIAEFHTLINYQ